MDFFVKLTYSALFGALAYLLFLVCSKSTANMIKPLAASFVVLAVILGINQFSSATQFLPSKEIFHLIKFDFALPVLYLLARSQNANFRNNAPQAFRNSALFTGQQILSNWLIDKGIFLMTLLYQLVVIWLLTWDYLVQARWH